ncbi:hypothetical protein MSIM_53520 [Mycobacterium simiae]|nr:hypothetical protein MSIM_53520 [Mycobacterium simiae]
MVPQSGENRAVIGEVTHYDPTPLGKLGTETHLDRYQVREVPAPVCDPRASQTTCLGSANQLSTAVLGAHLF